jgi:hypothetical protein
VIIIRFLIAPFVAAGVALCCFAAELVPLPVERDPVEIVGSYSLGKTQGGRLQFYGPTYIDENGVLRYRIVADEEVVRIGWDEDFILVEQHPVYDHFGTPPDPFLRKWYVVVVSTGREYHDLSYEDLLRVSDRLHVPATIEMRDARGVYYGR